MKDLFGKIFYNDDIYVYNISNESPLEIQFPKLNPNLKLTQTITFKTSIENPYCKNIFFEYFPYQNLIPKDYPNLQPPMFFEMNAYPKYLLTVNQESPKKENCPYLDYLKTLNFKGILKQKKNKEVYLEIDESLIKFINSSLKNLKLNKFNDFNITIISKDEYERFDVFKILELDETFDFKIKDIYSINVNKNGKIEKIWYLEIESKELEEFRYKHHLFPKRNGYNLYIKLGFGKQFKLRKTYPNLRINNSFFAA